MKYFGFARHDVSLIYCFSLVAVHGLRHQRCAAMLAAAVAHV
jgi:hypothetical protein